MGRPLRACKFSMVEHGYSVNPHNRNQRFKNGFSKQRRSRSHHGSLLGVTPGAESLNTGALSKYHGYKLHAGPCNC